MTKVDVPPLDWHEIGAVSPDGLVDTRLELHWAAQLIGAVPLVYLDEAADFSHANLGWIANDATFVTRQVGSLPLIRVGLNLQDFALAILDADDTAIDDLELEGTTLDEGYAWIAEMMDRYGVGDMDASEFHRPGDDFPDHVVGAGAAFTGGHAAAREELIRWYDNALLVFSEAVGNAEGASPVRTWPHHFDIATLITLEAAEDPEKMRSVGVGMTPGDSSYAEPYVYVTPWPYPKEPTLSSLEGNGTWHTEGWIGAVLTGSRLIEGGADGATQAERARAFLGSAIPAVRALAGG
jgi:hypothetical protein